MDVWKEQDKSELNQNVSTNYDNIVVTHDLQDCFDETFDLCFNKVINYTKINDTKDSKTENAVYFGKIHGTDENSGLVKTIKKHKYSLFIFIYQIW